MAINLTALAAELNSDPIHYGYAALIVSGDDTGLAALLNKARDGSDTFPAISVRKTDISADDLVEAIDIADMATITIGAQTWLQMLAAVPVVQLLDAAGANTRILSNLRAIFAAGTGTRSRINTLANRVGSRAEQLFGSGTVVADLDIAHALRPVQAAKA